jgi:protein-tyrosine-phosphatase
MRTWIPTGMLLSLGVSTLLSAAVTEAQRKTIDEVTGATGVYSQAEDTHKVSFAWADVKVAVEGRSMHPFLGLTSWAAFTPDTHGALMVMGDLVLFEDEVNPAMSAAVDNGLEVTALHNHFFFDSPRVMFMHIGGSGSAEKLAAAVRRTLDRVKEVRSANPQPGSRFAGPTIPETNAITAAPLDAILGVKGQANAGMYKAVIGRKASMHGKTVDKEMGVNTWAAFAGTDQAAFVDGDFAMLESEVQPVLKALRKAGINIVAIHNHMTHEEPQYIFLHYWGKGPAVDLARGLRSALDTQKSAQVARVLFVCEHGAAKSVIAAAYFNKLAAERGIDFQAAAAGMSPDPQFNAATIAGLRADGFPPLSGRPRLVESDDVLSAKRVITMGATLPVTFTSVRPTEWNDTPSVSADYSAARDSIKAHVEALLAELAPKHGR